MKERVWCVDDVWSEYEYQQVTGIIIIMFILISAAAVAGAGHHLVTYVTVTTSTSDPHLHWSLGLEEK